MEENKKIMNDYYVDLGKRKKSIPRMILGIISVIFAVLWLFFEKNNLGYFNIIYSIIFFVGGIGHFYEGTGNYLSTKFFGKSFIELNDELFRVKLPGRNPLSEFKWGNVKSLKVGLIRVDVVDKTNKSHQIDLSKLDYEIVVELKRRLSELEERLKLIVAA